MRGRWGGGYFTRKGVGHLTRKEGGGTLRVGEGVGPLGPFFDPNLATLAPAGLPLLACGALFYLCYTLTLIHTHSLTLTHSVTLTLTPLTQPSLALTPPLTHPPPTPRPYGHSLPTYPYPLLPHPLCSSPPEVLEVLRPLVF